ncbi:hypothetical protein, conserved [Eimeria acervulina]|uniref:Uncharacterized protein n=1 Tax=Eimeria acervulina TaxID=5801 RepID=U6GY38_EIMAC|nr:hypothetical protein, conserved [Eimeria acervulina]CDI84148.1 hypothetical protein, conserved [Eimeria acervulina]
MAALCRKYERPDDPPPDSSNVFDLTDEEMRGWSSESKKLHAALKEAAEAAGEDAGMLHNFLNKIAAVSLEAACLERSLSLLTEKTASLKESVKRQKEEEVLLIDSTGSPPVSVLSVSRLSCKETSTLKPRQTAAANTA